MGIYLNPGNEGFTEAIRSEIYVDKSMLLAYTNRVLGTMQKTICVSRPRRFGKSLAVDMLAAYYGRGCDSADLFANLKIVHTPDFRKHLNQHHVIRVDMTSIRHKRISETREAVSAMESVDLFHMEIIRDLKKEFSGSIRENDVDLPTVLTRIHEDTGVKFIIIIDEWDTIFREDKNDLKAQEAYVNLLRGLFKDAGSKKFLELAYITGILPIKKYGTQSALNNFREFTMINPGPLSEFVGFTEDEVNELCKRYHMDFQEAKRWYDGYAFRNISHVYSPNSVVYSMLDRDFYNYWTRTETYETLKYYICMNYDGLKDVIVKMIAGNRCKVNPEKFQNDLTSIKGKDDILTLLIHLGYLAYDMEKKEVYIPNEEVRDEFKNAVEETGWDSVIQAIVDSDNMLKATWQMDEDAVARGLEKVHEANTSILAYNDENSLSCVVSLAYYNAVNEYTLIREMPAGKGYADVVFLPRRHSDKPAMVVELKVDRSADSALEQIKERHYFKALEEYKGNLLLVGISYDKTKKKHECHITQMRW